MAGSAEEAEKIANAMVGERLAACCSIKEDVRSLYRWDGRVESAVEVELTLKTMSGRYRELEARIGELHSYDNPEIVAVELYTGSRKYIDWLQSSTATD